MKEKTKRPGAGYWFLFLLTALLFAALLELNKNTLAAWGAAALVLLLFALLRRLLIRGGFLRRLLT